jgi:hypothetical protein
MSNEYDFDGCASHSAIAYLPFLVIIIVVIVIVIPAHL